MTMKVLHVIPSVSPSRGGPSFALSMMAKVLTAAGVEVTVATTDDDGPDQHLPIALGCLQRHENIDYIHFHRQTNFYCVSLPLAQWLASHIREYDLLHIHGLFNYPSTAAARIAWRARVPYVIRPFGVLNRWGMENRRPWMKQLSFHWIEGPILRRAAMIHYTSDAEEEEATQTGAEGPATVLPLGIDVTDFQHLPHPGCFYARFPHAEGHPLILFLSRLDAKKGLDILLPAFAKIVSRHPKARLVIAGDGAPSFQQRLHEMAKHLQIADRLIWTGFLHRQEKLAALAAATVFTLPSYSENFGIALVEALAAGLPSVLTDAVAVAGDVKTYEAGEIIIPEVDALAAALDRLLSDEALRNHFATNARRLASERYSLHALSNGLCRMYRRVAEAELERISTFQ